MAAESPLVLRAAARVVDFGVQLGVLELAARIHDVVPLGPLLHLREDVLIYVDVGIGLTTMVAGLAVAEWFGGATVGKLSTGIRVVDAGEGAPPPTFHGAVLRNVALGLDALFFGLVAYSAMGRSPRRQRVGDVWGHTVVVRRADAPPRRGSLGALLGVAATLGLVLLSYLVV